MFRRQREAFTDQINNHRVHVYQSTEYVDGGGSVLKVKGAGTADEDIVVVQGVAGFNLANNSDAEVDVLSGASDSHYKRGIVNLPHSAQRKWAAGTGGIQSPTDPKRAVEINSKRTYIDDKAFALLAGIFELKDGKIYIRGDVIISGSVSVAGAVISPTTPQTPLPSGPAPVVVPGFEE